MALVKNYTQIPNELFQNQNLDIKAIGLYAYLKYRSYSGNAQKSFPCQKTMMKELGIGSSNTFKKIVDELIKNEFLKVKKGSIFTGNSSYDLLIPKKCENDTC